MSVRIDAVTAGSPADKAGILPDDRIVSINDIPVQDEIDYQSLSSARLLKVITERNHTSYEYTIRKAEWTPLGLSLDETESMKPRHCRNRCLFCFVDQLPQGMRETLYVKDDDWRLSLMMGNYVTLTNVSEEDHTGFVCKHGKPIVVVISNDRYERLLKAGIDITEY